MQFQFNTGRQYGPEGQRIVVKTTSDGIRFHDVDRCIEGFIRVNPSELQTYGEVQRTLMFCYDRGIYEHDMDSYVDRLTWEDEA